MMLWIDVTGCTKCYKAWELVPQGKSKWVGNDEGQEYPLQWCFMESATIPLSTFPESGVFFVALVHEAGSKGLLPVHLVLGADGLYASVAGQNLGGALVLKVQ